MQECCTCGSVRGALGNQRPYRDSCPVTRRSIKGAPCGVGFEYFSSTAPEEERPL